MHKIRDINDHLAVVDGVTGIIRVKRDSRYCQRQHGPSQQLIGGQVNDGPLAPVATHVMSLQLHDVHGDRIDVFFYDSWARRMDFLKNGMVLKISGPSAVIARNAHGQGRDHGYVLTIAPPSLLSNVRPNAPRMVVTVSLLPAAAAASAASGGGPVELTIKDPVNDAIVPRIDEFLARATAASAGAAAARGGGGSGAAGGGQRRSRGQHYEYTKLGEIRLETHRGVEVNIYAVVCSFTHPKPTQGSDQLATVILLDPVVDPSNPIVCNIFRSDPSLFPKFKAAGDIIRMHRVKVNEYQNKIQLVGWGGTGRGSNASYLAISRKLNAPPLPQVLYTGLAAEGSNGHQNGGLRLPQWSPGHWDIHATSDQYTFDAQDEAQVMRLWAWRTEALRTTFMMNEDVVLGPRNVEQVFARLAGQFLPRQIPPPSIGSAAAVAAAAPSGGGGEVPGDFVALVLAKTSDMITVWDGSGQGGGSQTLVAEATAQSLAKVLKLAQTGPRWEALVQAVKVFDPLTPFPLDLQLPTTEDLRKAFGHQGSRLQIRIPPTHKFRLDSLGLQPGRWIRVKHLAINRNPVAGNQEAQFGLNTSINPMPFISLDVHRVAVRFLQRWQRDKFQRAVAPCVAIFQPTNVRPHRCRKPLAYIIEALGSSAPTTFAIRARLVSLWPADPKRVCVPYQPSSILQASQSRSNRTLNAAGSSSKGAQWRFFFSIRLKDDTGALDAVLSDEVAKWFLGDDDGIHPCDLTLPANRPVLQKVEEAFSRYKARRSLVDLVIKSYVVAKRGNGEDGGMMHIKRFRLCLPEEASAV